MNEEIVRAKLKFNLLSSSGLGRDKWENTRRSMCQNVVARVDISQSVIRRLTSLLCVLYIYAPIFTAVSIDVRGHERMLPFRKLCFSPSYHAAILNAVVKLCCDP